MALTKKRVLIVLFALLLIISSFALFACGDKDKEEKKVESITLLGTLKSEYYVNEKFSGAAAKLYVQYEDDSTKEINITADMVLGFNTSDIVDDATATIIYRGKSITFTYSVYPFKYGYYTRTKYDASDNVVEREIMYWQLKKNGEVIDQREFSGVYYWRYEDGKISFFSDTEEMDEICTIVNSTTLKETTSDGYYLYKFTHA